eukprot:CAMPEP_0182420796 /NCGR_PEP_ID=MMETSP1167-20130531/5871_1 /TAXON_ID=2988 /ORGANISM="Mallomonas Sp, Strain CCMP3275" /LENGTH=656 /DNA_ID=CAMNT_0024597247 /DNA_START=640 /DNA_END=2610 /DNA_ORIENTATION=-
MIAGVGLLIKIITTGSASPNSHLDIFSSICLALGTILYISIISYWGLRLNMLKRDSEEVKREELNCFLYAVLFLVYLLALWAEVLYSSIIHGDALVYEDFMVFEILYLAFVLLLSLFQSFIYRNLTVKLKDEVEMKRAFTRYISHEVRTPLNTAIMGLQLLTEEMTRGDDSESLEIVSDIRHSCQTAVNTLSEFLTFDKLEGGTMMLEKTETKAIDMIEDTIHPFNLQARQNHVKLKIVPKIEDLAVLRSVMISVDQHKMAQVIRNMVSNALKFTPPNGSVNVFIDLFDEEIDNDMKKMLKLDVTDSGAGISEENQKKLFKEVIQFNPGKLQKGGGSGLGLYISYGITLLHGGKLSVYSAGEGFGTTFTLVLPAVVAPLPESAMSERVVDGISSSNQHGFIRAFRRMPSVRAAMDMNHSDHPNSENGNGHDSSDAVSRMKPKSSAVFLRRHTLRMNAVGCSPGEVDQSCTPGDVIISTSAKPRSLGGSFHGRDGSRVMAETSNRVVEHKVQDDEDIPWHELHILVVEDSFLSRRMQVRVLKKRCKTISQAEDGQMAVQLVKAALAGENGAKPFDIIVMDSDMPVLGGIEATKQIRDMGFSNIIIGMAVNVTVEEVEEFVKSGTDAVLEKPLDMEAFDLVMQEMRRRKRVRGIGKNG